MINFSLTVSVYDPQECGRYSAAVKRFDVERLPEQVIAAIELDKIAVMLAAEARKEHTAEYRNARPDYMLVCLGLDLGWKPDDGNWNTVRGTAELAMKDLPTSALSAINIKKLVAGLIPAARADQPKRQAEEDAYRARIKLEQEAKQREKKQQEAAQATEELELDVLMEAEGE